MSDAADSPGSPKQEKPSPKTPPSTPQEQHTITVIKGSEAEELKARETVVSENEISLSVNGMDVTVTTSVNGTDEQKGSAEEEVGAKEVGADEVGAEAEVTTSTGSMQEEEDNTRSMEEDEASYDEDMENWIVRRLTQEEIDDIIADYPQIPQSDLNQYLDFFWSVDQKGYGFFTIREFSKMMKQKRKKLSDKKIAQIFSDLDRDHDFVVSLDEFLEEMSKTKVENIRLLIINNGERKYCLAYSKQTGPYLRISIVKEAVRPVFESIDLDKDGVISEKDFDEWCYYNQFSGGIPDALEKAMQRDVKFGGPKIDQDYFYKLVKRHWRSGHY